jgi:hypothetical protein
MENQATFKMVLCGDGGTVSRYTARTGDTELTRRVCIDGCKLLCLAYHLLLVLQVK